MAIHLVVYDSEEQPSDQDIPLFLSMFPEFEGHVTQGFVEWDYIVHEGFFKGTRFHLKDDSIDIDKLFLIIMSLRDTPKAKELRFDELGMRRWGEEVKSIVFDWMTAVEATGYVMHDNQGTRLIPFTIDSKSGKMAALVADVNRQRMRSV